MKPTAASSSGKPARTQAARRADAERRLLNAAIRLLVDKGYDRFTLAEVGDLAGYSRGLPGHYFGKKDELLSEVARYIIAHYINSPYDVEVAEPGLPRLLAGIRKYISGLGNRHSRALAVLIAEARFHPTLCRTINDLNQQGARHWEAVITAGIEAGNIRPLANVQGEALSIYVFLRGLGGFADLDPNFDVAAAVRAFTEMLVARIAADPLSAQL